MQNHPEIKSSLFREPLKIFASMLQDIENAKQYIYLESYKWGYDPLGIKFKNALVKKSKEGVEIRLLIDSWGTYVSEDFFADLVEFGGKVKFFKKIRYSINFVSANHERNHRKLLVIDDQVVYISSLNITNYNLNWSELSLRLEDDIAISFKNVFLGNWRLKNTYRFDKRKHTRLIRHGSFLIIRDVPSIAIQKINRKYQQMIRNAKEQILIETPYFLPTKQLRDLLMDAANRGLDIKVIMPMYSDVRMINILKDFYIGKLHQSGIKLFFYLPGNLHSKFMVADDQFLVTTSNFDYRSFRYQFEVGLYGNDQGIVNSLKNHVKQTITDSTPFEYSRWVNRSRVHKMMERMLLPMRHFL
jgi:cardiolipin synthase A/B